LRTRGDGSPVLVGIITTGQETPEEEGRALAKGRPNRGRYEINGWSSVEIAVAGKFRDALIRLKGARTVSE
jgi:hypothetical protein